MCHECYTNARTSGYLTSAPCGEPIFVEYPVFTPENAIFGCKGVPTPCNPWVDDLFTYRKFPYINLDYLDKCPCENAGPLI